MDTSRVDGVKAPLHDGTPRSRVFLRVPDVPPPAVAPPEPLELPRVELAALHALLVGLSSTSKPGHALPTDSSRCSMQPQFYSSVGRLASSPIRSEVGHDLPTRPLLEELLGLGQFYTRTVFPRTKTKERPSFYDGASSFEEGFALYECFETGRRDLLAAGDVEVSHPQSSRAQLAES